MDLLARLDSTGLRVLCSSGDRTCRGELARVAILESGKRVLCMLDGWKRKKLGDGRRDHWALSNHSARRLRGAEAAVAMGSLAPDQLHERARPRLRRPIPSGKDVNLAAYGLVSDNYVTMPLGKISATCPRCGHVNTLTAAHLRVATR